MRIEGKSLIQWRGSVVNRVPVMYALMLLTLVVVTFGTLSPGFARVIQSENIPAEPVEPRFIKVKSAGSSSSRDSLRQEIQRYSQAISGLRDSLNFDEFDLQISEDQRLRVEQTIEDLTLIIEQIGGELGQMELEIANNRISLLDDQGEGIIIDIPENLDEQLSQGFELLQHIILSEMPEEQSEKIRNSWSWGMGREEPEPERIILKGNIVKIGDSLQVSEDEDVRGNVIVVFGDGEISGRVDGNVTVIFGNLRLNDTAEVTGEVVAVGGHLDQDRLAEVNDVVVVDPFPGWDGPNFGLTGGLGILGLVVGLGEFLLVLLLSLLVLAIMPRNKLDRVLKVIEERSLPCLGAGVVGTLVISLLGLTLIGVLVLTVIGIPVALLVLVAILLFSVLSVAVVSLTIGRRVCTLMSGTCGSDWMVVVLGLILLDSISLVGLLAGLFGPLGAIGDGLVIIGAGLKMVAYLFGAGSLVLSGLGRK